MSKDKIVKLQLLGMRGDNKNVTLTKTFTVANAIDGHFETDRETAETLLAKLNVAGEKKMLAKEGDPEYTAPVEVVREEIKTAAELNDEYYALVGKVKVLEQDLEAKEKELQESLANQTMPKDKAVEALTKENAELKAQLEFSGELAKENAELKKMVEDLEKTMSKDPKKENAK